MKVLSEQAQEQHIINTAYAMCAAARTAPKAKGQDYIRTCILTGDDKTKLADEMLRLADENNAGFFKRDAANINACSAVVVIGTAEQRRGLDKLCTMCHFDGCADCAKADGVCIFDPLDLGIAIGSAVSAAADARVDNRVMFSAGKAALTLKLLGDDVHIAMCIPLSVSGKSPFFDRK